MIFKNFFVLLWRKNKVKNEKEWKFVAIICNDGIGAVV